MTESFCDTASPRSTCPSRILPVLLLCRSSCSLRKPARNGAGGTRSLRCQNVCDGQGRRPGSRAALPRPREPPLRNGQSNVPAFCARASPSSRIAPFTFDKTSGGMLSIWWAVLACSAAFLKTSCSESQRISWLHPGLTSLHFRTFDIEAFLTERGPG
jgi:hypothetical protein